MTHVQQNTRAFKIGVLLNTIYIVIEASFGLAGNSLALLADAGHNLSDVLGLLVSWLALWLGQKAATSKRTYGYKSSSILAALFNAVFLLVAIGGIAVEAVQRLLTPAPVASWSVIIVAAVGVLINGLTAWLFVAGQKDDLNIRGAFLHMAADAGVSVGVVLVGALMLLTGWTWLDSIVSLVIAAVILISTWNLLKAALNFSLNAVPDRIDLTQVQADLCAQPTVAAVHDLHVWGMSTTEVALTVHVIRTTLANNNDFLEEMNHDLQKKYGICHITIQTELGKVADETTDHSI